MAVTIDRGLSATDDPLAVDLKVSMDEKVGELDASTSQFSTMLMKLDPSIAKSFKEEWMDDQYLPKNTALSASAASGDTTLSITTNEGNYAKPGDTGKFVVSGEVFRIDTITASSWTVTRAIGSVAAASAASGTGAGGIIILAGSNEQGGTLPTALVTEKVSDYNYMQIVRNSYRFTASAEWQGWYSGNPLAYHRKKIGVEHKRDLENQVFFGARSYTAGTNAPRGTFGGLDQYVTTNITDTAGTLSKGAWADFLRTGLEYGERNRKAFFCAPLLGQVLSQFLQDNWVRARPEDTVWGVKADAVIDAVFGARIPVFIKGDWNRYTTGTGKQIGSRGYLVDLTQVSFKKAPATSAGPRYLTLYGQRQARDADEVAEEYLSEVTFCIHQEKAHAVIRGVSG